MGKHNYKDWIISLYNEYGIDQEANVKVYSHYDEGLSSGIVDADIEKENFKRYCRSIRLQLVKNNYFDKVNDEQDTINHNIGLMKKNQRLQDLNRIERKTFRESARVENTLTELNKELIQVLSHVDLTKFTKEHKVNNNSKYVGVIQLSDLHLNELVEKTEYLHNHYDFTIASKRLQKLIVEAKLLFKSKNVKNVILAMTGDLLNNDSILDKKLGNATNRTKASVLALYIIEQLILDLNKDFNVTIASVTGNESRVDLDYNSLEFLVSNSYDVLVDKMLKMIFRDCKGITFANQGTYIERILNVGKTHILLLHGDRIKQGQLENEIYNKIAKYAHEGIRIDYVMLGHIHQSYISDLFGRSGSLVGGNAYSNTLNLISKASQNLYIVEPDKREIVGIKVDLQDTEGFEGYDIKKELEEYNAKSAEKLKDRAVVFQVVI